MFDSYINYTPLVIDVIDVKILMTDEERGRQTDRQIDRERQRKRGGGERSGG